MKNSIPRIRSVTDKATGRQVRVFRQYPANDRKTINGRLQTLMDNFFGCDPQKGAGGFAFVLFDKEGASMTAASVFTGATVHRATLPEFVKGCLANNIAKDW